ncbi:hypothetical protein OL239_15915 [Arthrobacter sp. ATA002]|uniref:hypothetical protein n=1 Tax=Arthrobacter sp. ATA002 TaxID=2991715 RepID=UPI0022A6C5EE|nr:hypothetical protein [Arthrobacter sp. ATA002]WAP51297.1 hypothetical protein OL239_15915 [Arthrobacter sp. ATA002]
MRYRRGALAVAAGMAAVAVLAGCEVPALEPKAAEELQAQVAEVSESAAAGDYEAALSALEELTVRLDAAEQLGEVSGTREDRISDAIAAVRLNLETELSLSGGGN